MKNHCPNSTNEVLYLQKTQYPNDDFESYFITAQKVKDVLDAGKIPEIRLSQEIKGPKIAVVLAVEKHPDRDEPDYYIPEFYVEAIIKHGGNPVFVGFDKTTEQLENLQPRAIMLIGGDFKFPEDWAEEKLAHDGDLRREKAYEACVEYAKKELLPVLGICAGEQILAGMHGAKLGRVEKHRGILNEYCHNISIKENSLLHRISGLLKAPVNSNHYDVVSAKNLGDCIVTAKAEDGTVEAIELKHPWHWFVLGLQWHPERFYEKDDELTDKIFGKFVFAARGATMIDEREENFAEANLVEITDPHFIVDMIYAKNNNLSGHPIYEQVGLGNKAYIRKEMWERLQKIIPWLEQNNMKLKICDAYRPPEAHMALKAAINETGGGIFASRAVISKHCHGTAIDVLLTDIEGNELSYPTLVDCYTPELTEKIRKNDTKEFYEYCKQGRHDYQNPNMKKKIANREQLRELIESIGLQRYKSEWWHYEMPDEFNFVFPMINYR